MRYESHTRVVHKNHPILAAILATSALAIALVFAIRAMIPSEEPSLSRDASAAASDPPAQRELAPVEQHTVDATAAPVATASIDASITTATVVAAQELPTPSLAPTINVDPPAQPQTAASAPDDSATPEPLDTIRAELTRVRASSQALMARLGDASARQATIVRATFALSEGPALVRRLAAGDPAFADQLARYREAISSNTALDAAGREALRARIFDASHLERATVYDDVLQLLRQ